LRLPHGIRRPRLISRGGPEGHGDIKKMQIFAPQNNRMKRYYFVGALALLLAACSGDSSRELIVEGRVRGLKKGTLYLQQVQDSSLVTLDSMPVGDEGEFRLKGQIDDPDLFYLYLNKADNNDMNDRIVFFAEPGVVRIDTRWNAFEAEAEIEGTELQEQFREYRRNQSRFHVQELEVAHAIAGLSLPQDSLAMDSLENVSNRIALRSYLYALNFALNNRDSYLAPFVACTEVSDANPKYLDSIYKALNPEVAESKYGKKLKELLEGQ